MHKSRKDKLAKLIAEENKRRSDQERRDMYNTAADQFATVDPYIEMVLRTLARNGSTY
jgi:hypothetical protein